VDAVWPIGLYFILVVLLIIVMLVLSYLLGQRHDERATGVPYEGGIVSEGSAHVRFSARYYLISMFFVVFDLEAVFIFAWAVAAKEVGWAGYWEVLIFIGVLVATLIYLWRLGALDWSLEPRRRR
jgi:NADH-quinone oxidoreductase subunit A